MSDSHNAPALPAPNRRSFLTTAAVAAGVSLATGSVAVAAAAPDSRLLGLVDDLKQARAAERAKDELIEDRYRELAAACPPPRALGLLPPHVARESDPHQIVYWARDRIKHFSLIIPMVAGPEFIAATDAFEAQIELERQRLGLPALGAELDELTRRADALETEIMETPAETIVGIVAKLRAFDIEGRFSLDPGPDHVDSDPYEHWKGEMLRDAERIAGLPLSLPASTTEA